MCGVRRNQLLRARLSAKGVERAQAGVQESEEGKESEGGETRGSPPRRHGSSPRKDSEGCVERFRERKKERERERCVDQTGHESDTWAPPCERPCTAVSLYRAERDERIKHVRTHMYSCVEGYVSNTPSSLSATLLPLSTPPPPSSSHAGNGFFVDAPDKRFSESRCDRFQERLLAADNIVLGCEALWYIVAQQPGGAAALSAGGVAGGVQAWTEARGPGEGDKYAIDSPANVAMLVEAIECAGNALLMNYNAMGAVSGRFGAAMAGRAGGQDLNHAAAHYLLQWGVAAYTHHRPLAANTLFTGTIGGNLMFSMGRPLDAMYCFESLLDICKQPGFPNGQGLAALYHNYCASCQLATGDIRGAERSCQSAIDNDPDNPEGHAQRGMLYSREILNDPRARCVTNEWDGTSLDGCAFFVVGRTASAGYSDDDGIWCSTVLPVSFPWGGLTYTSLSLSLTRYLPSTLSTALSSLSFFSLSPLPLSSFPLSCSPPLFPSPLPLSSPSPSITPPPPLP